MDDRRAQRRSYLRNRLAEAPEGTLALFYELMDAAHHEYGTTTRSLFRELCDESGITFERSDAGTHSDPATPIERPPSPTPGQLRAMERAADDHYEANLKKSVLYLWRDKARVIREMEVAADHNYATNLKKDALRDMRTKLVERQAANADLELRSRFFDEWRNKRLIERCLRAWILRHRENSLRNFQEELAARSAIKKWHKKTGEIGEQNMRADDARDFMAASSALKLWREKARQQQGLRRLTKLYLQIKWFTIWRSKAKALSRARYDNLLKDKYREAKHRFAMRSTQKFFDVWRQKTAHIRESERIADEYCDRFQEERTRKTAHDALTKMYLQTAESLENERIADEHYARNVIGRLCLLDVDGPWRGKVRDVQKMESKADEYREIKTQEVARDAVRTMRNQSARTRQMETQASEFYDRHSKKLAQAFLHTWREKTAERQGVEDMSAIAAPPATPAARRSALFRTVQQTA